MRVSRFGILFSFIAISVISVPAFGQAVDPNLQVRIETALPPPEIKPHLPVTEKVPIRRTEPYITTETVPLSIEERKQRLQKIMTDKGLVFPMETLSPKALEERLQANGIGQTETRKVKRTRVYTDIVEVPVERKTTVTASAQTQAAFDTNATKSNAVRASDWVFSTNGALTVNIPVGLADSLVLQTAVADQRYAKLVSKDIEILANSATYIQVLSAVHGPKLSSPGTTTVDAISYSLASNTVFGSGFHPYQVELFTPSIAWGRGNINLGGTVCGPKGQEVYCLAGNVVSEGEYTFSDIASQENVAAKLQGNMTWQTPVAGLTTTAAGTIQGKYFTGVPRGRQDLILQAVARADYFVNPAITLSAVLQVTQQFSTLRTAEWNGLTVFPLARLQFRF